MQSITPFLWFDTEAEAAAKFYCSIFPNSRIDSITYYGEHAPLPKGTVSVVGFTLNGQLFSALNGGPTYRFTPAVSFAVECDTQNEIDDYWEKLSEGGKEVQCGWLTDKFGLSWQIVPRVLGELLSGADEAAAGRVMTALMGMVKLDIGALQEVYHKG